MAVSPRSCTTCRRRKVRCDRVIPSCSNCTRARIDCHFPARRRAARESESYAPLLARIRSLEDTVHGRTQPLTQSRDHQSRTYLLSGNCTEGNLIADDTGRVDVRTGGSVYRSSSSWTNFLGDTALEARPRPFPVQEVDEPSSILGPTYMVSFLKVLRPSGTAVSTYWQMFKRRVEPLLKIVHAPTFEPEFLLHAQNLDQTSPYFQCVLFAICYGATASATAQECQQFLGEERTVLISRYSLALRKLFSAVDLLATDDIRVLQALVIYLFCLPRQESRRADGALAGMTLCIAQSLGIHRDGAKLGFSPFQTEMRRRLWWQTRLLNLRASMENSVDFITSLTRFDNTLPLNVNDDALSPHMLTAPSASPGLTDMSLCLVRIELLGSFAQHLYHSLPDGLDIDQASLSNADWIAREESRIQERYLRYCNDFHALSLFTSTVAQLLLGKFALILHCQLQAKREQGSEHILYNEKLFVAALETIERANKLNTEARWSEWNWLSRSYTQCHAAAYILSQLDDARSSINEAAWGNGLADQAWSALEVHMGHQLSDDGPRQDPAMQALADAFHRAQETRHPTNRDVPTTDASSSMTAFDWGIPFTDLQAELGLDGEVESNM